MSGVVQGGWEFVVAAYAVTAAVLGAYTASVIVRLARGAAAARRRADEEQP